MEPLVLNEISTASSAASLGDGLCGGGACGWLDDGAGVSGTTPLPLGDAPALLLGDAPGSLSLIHISEPTRPY